MKTTFTNNTDLSRRSFVIGSTALLIGAGLSLSGCGQKNKITDKTGSILAALAHSGDCCSPIANTNPLFWSAGWHVYEGLYDFDYSSYSIYNGLAAMKPTKLSSTKYRIVLRDGAKFSNGQKVVSFDVVNAFNKNIENELFKVFLDPIKQIAAVSDKVMEIDLKYPFESLLENRLALLKVFPASMSESELNSNPIGSGPWMYENIDGSDGGNISFIPNPHYNGQYVTEAKRMDWTIIENINNRTSAFSSGNVMVSENINSRDVTKIKSSDTNIDSELSSSQVFLCFNCLKFPTDDYRIRQAIHYGIDTDKLIKEKAEGNGSPASCILPDNHSSYHSASYVYGYNPSKAKEILKKANASNINLNLYFVDDNLMPFAHQIANDLNNIGITINIEKHMTGSIFNSTNNMKYDILLMSSHPSMFGNDPDLIMSYWYCSDSWMNNISGYAKSRNNRYAELKKTLQSSRESQSGDSQKYYNICYDIIAEECPIYPIFHMQLTSACYGEKLGNFKAISAPGLNLVGANVLQKS